MYVLKTLCVWRIFSHFGKLSAAWSDSRLLVVVLIGSAVMLILSIVTIHDLKHVMVRSFRVDTAPPYYEYTSICLHNASSRSHTMVSIVATVIQVGLFIILFILPCISFKTRNISCSNFKETKRTHLLL